MLVPSIILIAVLAIATATFIAGRSRSPGAGRPPRAPFWRWLWGGMAVFSLALAALFAFAFYDRYWLWRDCFNELGRCYDPEESMVYLEQAGMIWGGMTSIALVAAVTFALLCRKR